jgi:hypothetical protein
MGMQTLRTEDYKLMKTLVGLSQEGLRRTMTTYLEKKYDKVIATKDYIMAQGDIPIALVAHMDTVFTKPATKVYYDKEQGVMWSPQGLGADDRAGIFCIIKILQGKLRPTVILTTDEEKGCVGASQLIERYTEAPWDLNYIIQLDRRGSTDCVFYDCENPEFTKYVESFGFIEEIGSFSDISVICPDWKIAGVNLSVGYEGEHSETEILHVAPLLATIDKVKIMLSQNEIPKFEYIPAAWSWGLYSKYYKHYGIGGASYAYPLEEDYVCKACGKQLTEYEIIPAFTEMGEEVYFCSDCCVDHVDWCDSCNDGFVLKSPKDKTKAGKHICPSCQAKKTMLNKGDTRIDV